MSPSMSSTTSTTSEPTFQPSSSKAPNAVQRLKDRARYDEQTVYDILDTGLVAHVSFSTHRDDDDHIDDDEWPTVIPMAYTRIEHEIFLHGHLASRLLKALSEEGAKACITVTHVDGLVLALTPFHNSMNYRSVIVFGHARLIPDSEHERKIDALTAITNHPFRATSGDRWTDARPPSEADVKSTRVVSVPIEMASAKVRAGGPKDEKKDVENEDVIGRYWTGVIKSKQGWEAIQPGPYNRVAEPPQYVANLLK
ncbi:hypothetical protein BDY19DRAFT_48794 [Irpex rosettiformis]|uniref:Uncharacterized protein n=1 Tax=Irpex rosettiformis TaxID=378272 RepID=A0ACB8UKL1_9APHY|nr:hypothetical protein BDY19DRAFT_48794 [Irpex rosettiformis]